MIRYRSVLNRDPLTYAIRASNPDGTVWYPPVGATFEAAYLLTPGDPVSGDWKTGAFSYTRTGAVLGYTIIGPGSVIGTIAKGEYFEWARVTDPTTGVQSVRCVGRLVIE